MGRPQCPGLAQDDGGTNALEASRESQPSGYVELVGFILQSNGLPAGKTALPTSADALQKVVVNF